MAGGGGSTGGIGAQSPAVNPPNPMGQIGDAVGGALGGLGGQQQTMPYQPGGFGGDMGGGEYSSNPMGGLERPQVGYDGGSTLSNMGNNTRLGNNMGQQQTMPYQPAIGMPGGQGGQTTYQNPNPQVGGPAQLGGNEFSTAPAVQPYSPSDARPTLLRPQMTMPYQPGDMGQQQALQQAMQQAQAMQQQGGMGQQLRGLAGLLGGMPNRPTPTAPPVSTTQPAPVAARPAPVAAKPLARPAPTRAAPAKPMAKPSVVPPKTPPAVARAIQKLAAKKPMMRR